MKKFIEKIWKWFVAWFMTTALVWLKSKWMRLVDLFIFFLAYDQFGKAEMPVMENLVGLWIFVLLGYNIFWQFFGAGKAVKALIAQKKAKKKK